MEQDTEEKITLTALLIEFKVWKEALSNFKSLYNELNPNNPETHKDLEYYHICIVYAEWKLRKLDASIEMYMQKGE